MLLFSPGQQHKALLGASPLLEPRETAFSENSAIPPN